MLTVMYEETKLRDPKDLKTLNFYHFRDMIAIPGMNDLIFRRRLFESCWSSRKQALNNVKAFIASGKQFSSVLTDKDASSYRDYLLLFGSKRENQELYLDEARYLPQNQHHKHHELYAQIIRTIRSKGGAAEEDQDLSELYAHLERNTPVVTDKWVRYWLEDEEDGTACGPAFYAPTAAAANQFCEFVENSHRSKSITGKEVGLCAMGFVVDPTLETEKCNEQQRQLYFEIKKIVTEMEEERAANLSEILGSAWNISEVELQ